MDATGTRGRQHGVAGWAGAAISAVLFALIGLVLAQGSAAATAPAAGPTPVATASTSAASPESTCVLARGLSDSGLPQQAVTTIDALGEAAAGIPDCRSALLSAVERIAHARLLVRQAQFAEADGASGVPTAPPVMCRTPALSAGPSSSPSTATEVSGRLLEWAKQCDAEVESASAPATPTEPDLVCQAAGDLVTAGRPQQALELLKPLGEDLPAECVKAVSAARVRAARATLLASLATSRLNGSDPLPPAATSPDAPCGVITANASLETLAKQALACDADNAVAADIAAGPGDDRWDGFVADYIEPQTSRALVFLGIIAALLVLARIGTMLLPARGMRVPDGQQLPLAVVSSLLIVAGAWAGTGDWGLLGADPSWPWRFLAAAVFGLLGAGLLAWVWSRRMRLGIRVVDDKDDLEYASTGHLAALIHELGGSTLHGLETPRGSDATAVDASGLTTTPEGRVVAALYRLLQLLVPLNPWAVRVEVSSDDRLTLSIRRNGHSVLDEVIDRDQLHLRIPISREHPEGAGESTDDTPAAVQPDLLRMAAAAVLFQLDDEYGFGGLGGARTWQSVGWQYVATTDLAAADKEAVALLARALDSDPANAVVEYLLWYRRYREATSVEDIERYAAWLDAFVETAVSKDVGLALLLRAEFTRAVMWINHSYAEASDSAGTQQVVVPKGAALDVALVKALRACESGSTSESDFAARTRTPVELLRLSLYPSADRLRDPTPDGWSAPDAAVAEKDVRSPNEAYQAACYFGSRTPLADSIDTAIRLLRRAEADPTVKSWWAKDPQLTALRRENKYREAFGRKPRTDILALPDFATFAPALKKAGATDPELLTGFGQTVSDLATRLEITRPAAQRLIAVAALARSATWPESISKDWYVELAGALSSLGVTDLAAQRRGGLGAEVRKVLGHDEHPFTSDPPSETELAAVLDPPSA